MGLRSCPDLNTERSRKPWGEWKRPTDPLHYLDPIERYEAIRRIELQRARPADAAMRAASGRDGRVAILVL